MGIKETLAADLKQAMLAKDTLRRDVLRMLKSEIGAREVKEGDLDDNEALAVLQKAVKAREEVAAQYEGAGQTEAAEKERAEAAIIAAYLPKALTDEETREAVSAVIAELGLSGKKDMGRLMKELKARHGAALDGKLASRMAGEALG